MVFIVDFWTWAHLASASQAKNKSESFLSIQTFLDLAVGLGHIWLEIPKPTMKNSGYRQTSTFGFWLCPFWVGTYAITVLVSDTSGTKPKQQILAVPGTNTPLNLVFGPMCIWPQSQKPGVIAKSILPSATATKRDQCQTPRWVR